MRCRAVCAFVSVLLVAGCGTAPTSYLQRDPTTGEYRRVEPEYPRCDDVTLSRRAGKNHAPVCEVR